MVRQRFKVVKIKTGTKVRTIYVPSRSLKRELREALPTLMLRARKLDTLDVQHGFTMLRSPVTNAQRHVGFAVSLCFDLKDFFASVTLSKAMTVAPELVKKFPSSFVSDGTSEAAAHQGLPTSPAWANIVGSVMDNSIQHWLNSLEGIGDRFVYTRYADDLTVSVDCEAVIQDVKHLVDHVARRCGFALNDKKTHVQYAKSGRRIITGVAVDDKGVHPTREMKRRLRAALHQRNIPQARGLYEWCQLKAPSSCKRIEKLREFVDAYRSSIVDDVVTPLKMQVDKYKALQQELFLLECAAMQR